MTEITINGPVVAEDAHNVVLRECLLNSPIARGLDLSNYHTVEIGVREGAYTTWIGVFNQSAQNLSASVPVSVLPPEQRGRRLRAGQAIVARVTVVGTPESLKGAHLNIRMAHVGGREGPPRPLVAAGATVPDFTTRAAMVALERQINGGGLAEWEEGIQLRDPVELVVTGTFQGRLQVDSVTAFSLQRYNGNWVEVNGEALGLGVDGLSFTTTTPLVGATGNVGSAVVAASTLYCCYISDLTGKTQIALSGTTPTRYLGSYYLGTSGAAARWRFCGWLYTDSSTQFVDSETQRFCANYYNREVKDLFRAPGYVDNDTQTVETETSTSWIRLVLGANATRVEFISNAEDAAVLHATTSVSSSGAFSSFLGISVDSGSSAHRVGLHGGTDIGNIALHYSDVLSAGYHFADLTVRVSAGVSTYILDDERAGAAADPPVTYISGQVLV